MLYRELIPDPLRPLHPLLYKIMCKQTTNPLKMELNTWSDLQQTRI